jgi:DNA-binding response OmpR family regulator
MLQSSTRSSPSIPSVADLAVVSLLTEPHAGICMRIELVLTGRERLILLCLIAHIDEFVTDAQLLWLAYSLFESNFSTSSVRDDMNSLRRKLRAAIGYDPVFSTDDRGYRITRAQLSLSMTGRA